MKLFKNNLIKNYLVILTFLTLLEIFFRKISGIDVLNIAFLRIFIGLNFIAILLSYLFSWTSKLFSKIGITLVSFLFSVYAFFQLGFENFIGVYASLNTSSQLGAVIDYIKEFFASFLGKFYLIFIPLILLILYYVFFDKNTKKEIEKHFKLKHSIKYEPGIRTIFTVLALFLTAFLYNETLTLKFMQSNLQTVSNKDLFAYPSIPSLVINQFGVLGFGLLDIKSLYVDSSNINVYATNTSNEIDTNRKIDDTNWEKLINTEEDQNLNSISNYLINQPISDYNTYTGYFEGKNLIVIMMESVNEIFINQELYPNFYKMYSEGWSFTNNYSPRNSCATGNNEFSGMTSLYTIQNNCTANIYRNNTYYTAIFNLFNNAGYKTSSMHDYTEAYYYRSIIHPNLGSSIYYGVQDLGIYYYNEYKNWASDEDFIASAMDIVLQDTDNPFMLWLTTVSSHQPYSISSVEGDKYLDLTASTNYPMDLRRYMSKLKTLDNALGILLNRLEESGILDDTVIVMYGDHYPYGLKNSTINYVLDYDLDDYEVEKTPLVIYNSTTKPLTIDKYTSYINITPTIANLFNLEYDPRFYMGSDLFSEDYLNIVTFADGSWKNDKVYYDASKSEIKYYSDAYLNDDEIININNIVANKMQLSKAIIENNYYAYLEDALKDIASENETLALEENKEAK